MLKFIFIKYFKMKPVVFLILIFFSGSLMAQTDSTIVNTSWKGIIYIPSATEVVFTFSKDTLKLATDGAVLELMTYEQKGNRLQIKKVEGFSPCDNTAIWGCDFIIKENELFLNTISDDCGARTQSVGENAVFTRNKLKQN